MAKIGRNELCACGSGLKVKRCCGISRGPSEESLAVAFLRSAAREVAGTAGVLSEREFAVLLAELVDLPCLDLSLQVELPKLLSPALGRLCEAIAEDDELAGDAVIDLASGSRQLFCASLIEAVAVRAGVARTPGGVLLAA